MTPAQFEELLYYGSLFDSSVKDANDSAEIIIATFKNVRPEPVMVRAQMIGNKIRDIASASEYVKLSQQSFVRVSWPSVKGKFSPYSTGGISRKSKENAIEIACQAYREGKTWVLKLDLEDAFKNVPHYLLKLYLLKFFPKKWVNVIMRQWVKVNAINKNGTILPTDQGLHIGLPISPLLFNIFMTPLDRYCEKKGYIFYRHFDDIALFFSSEEEAKRVKAKLRRFIAKYIQIPLSKGKGKCCIREIHRVELLGYAFRTVETKSGRVRLVIRPAQKNIRKYQERILEFAMSDSNTKNIHKLKYELLKYQQQWIQAFPLISDRKFIRAINRWVILALVKRIFFSFTRNVNARFRHYRELLDDSNTARKIAGMKFSGAEATIRTLLSTGKIHSQLLLELPSK